MQFNLPLLLKFVFENNGSDLHISAGSKPRVRINGALMPIVVPGLESMTPEQTAKLCLSVLNEEQKRRFEIEKEVDLSFGIEGLARFRANIFTRMGTVGGAFRLITSKIKTLQELKLPKELIDLCKIPRGIILVTGPTGSGKSTTLAAMIDYINKTRSEHIVTIEDPIEYLHTHDKCIINQREVGPDTLSFKAALKSVLRQDPDVILLGELRDLETIETAITTAETGHLVFATLHTNTAIASLTRLIDVFPSEQQTAVRTQLASSMMGVISQMLLPSKRSGRVLAMELLLPNVGIRALIGEGKFNQIYSLMQSGQLKTGMQTMNQSLVKLVQTGHISAKQAIEKSPNKEEIQKMLGTGEETRALHKRRAR